MSKINILELDKQGLRKCKKCGDIKSHENFDKSKSSINGIDRTCKKCNYEKRKQNPNYLSNMRAATLKWRRDNPEKCKQSQKRNDARPQRKIKLRLIRRIKDYLCCKTESFKELIGCSAIELKQYLEKQFTPQMSWDNYGSYWHIDHKIPCAAFDLFNKDERLKCFHYTNLQPLEAKINLSKQDKIDNKLARYF